MKTLMSFVVILVFCTGLAAQETDSVMLEKVMKLKTEVSKLKAGQKKLNAKVWASSKETDAALEETAEKITGNKEAIDQLKADLSGLEKTVGANRQEAGEERTALGDWAKKMLMILGVIFLVLILVLLVLIITNRSRINKDYLKLEAKVDNTRDSIEVEIRDVLKKHEDDLASLKAAIDKAKK
jgi:Na+-transporting methylmalonyl-CoA/oxaloacetate decarboxylase gamma subunit